MSEWQPTLQLRRFDDTGKLTNPRLQQLWVKESVFEPSNYEWRDVPLVWEPAGCTAADMAKDNASG